MKAAVYFGDKNVQITSFKTPPLMQGCVKIEVHYCGLCGTDLHKYQGRKGVRPVIPPVVLGHEVSGVIVELGEGVEELAIGDRVVVDPNYSCGYCYYCKCGKSHMCENSKGVVKGFAEYVCPPKENVYKIKDTLSLKHAALAEPLSCCLHGMDLLNIHLGDTVLIIGFGSIGMMMTQLCKLAGASNIIVIETEAAKQKQAMQLGATLFINPNQENVNQAILNNNIKNVDRVMECVGLKATVEAAFDYAGKCATIVLFGVGDESEPASFNHYHAFQKELTVKSSFINPHTTERALALLESKTIDYESLISKTIAMEDIPNELATLTYFKQGKVIVHLKESQNKKLEK